MDVEKQAAEAVFQQFKHVKPRLNRGTIELLCTAYEEARERLLAKAMTRAVEKALATYDPNLRTSIGENQQPGWQDIATVAFVENKPDGSRKVQNFIPTTAGKLERIEARYNGLAVSYYPQQDYDGKPYLKPALSVICADSDLSELLHDAGMKLLPHLPTIELPTNQIESKQPTKQTDGSE